MDARHLTATECHHFQLVVVVRTECSAHLGIACHIDASILMLPDGSRLLPRLFAVEVAGDGACDGDGSAAR